MDNSITHVLVHINLIPGIGPAVVETLVKHIGIDNIDRLYDFKTQDFMHAGVKPRAADLLVRGLADRALLDRERASLNCHNISVITCFDKNYPVLLRHIHLPPIVLYYRGVFACEEQRPCIAFVGSRQAQNYCEKTARLLVPPLIQRGFCIVSGGALGADTIAHRVTLECGGKTIAVIGSGLLNPYPAQNSALFDVIVASGGALVSPFPLTSAAKPGNFPARNRIIAGLSAACVVLQAADKSGALITASCALEQGREVCAVPGSIDDPLSVGCHKLLSQGAHVATSAEDILNAIGFQETFDKKDAHVPKQVRDTLRGACVVRDVQAVNSFVVTKAGVSDGEDDQKSSSEPQDISLSPEEHVIRLCKKPVSFDDLLIQSSIEAGALRSLLFMLQCDGKLEQNFMGHWCLPGKNISIDY